MRLTERAHQHLEALIRPGDCVIDATAGNGHDTLKLAELVHANGEVIAIDLQASAIESTRARLEAAGVAERCELIESDHATALERLLATHRTAARAITFNLGYLPGSDKQVQTTPISTLPALDAAMQLLKPGGSLVVTAYRGHAGGMTEAAAVANWVQAQAASSECHEPTVSGSRIPPILWILSKA